MFKDKVSLITVSSDSFKTIKHTIDSVLDQTYPNIEYIIIDNASTDGTVDKVKSYENKISKFISEPDKGIYNAMNKGIKLATGNIVGILNSDDFFCNKNVIEKVVAAFQNKDVDSIYGDVQFIDPANINKIIRFYSSKNFKPRKFKFGFMPAHPSFYVKKKYFELLGYYHEDYKIAADFELLIRFLLVNNLRSSYIEMPFVSMRPGGVSNKSLKSTYILNKEIIRACRENGIKTNLFFVYSKYFIKFFEFFGHKD
jgi:glycosyltransferase involved in cell wall biosynthesis